jgi:hypothetical protein
MPSISGRILFVEVAHRDDLRIGRNSAFESKFIFASSATTWPLPVSDQRL